MDVDVKLGELKIEVPYCYRNTLGENFTTINDLFEIIDDLVYQKDKLQEEFDEYKQNVKDNYRFVGMSEQVGIDNSDFLGDR